jgi:hypothetical protein
VVRIRSPNHRSNSSSTVSRDTDSPDSSLATVNRNSPDMVNRRRSSLVTVNRNNPDTASPSSPATVSLIRTIPAMDNRSNLAPPALLVLPRLPAPTLQPLPLFGWRYSLVPPTKPKG